MKKEYESPEIYTEKLIPEIVKAGNCECSSQDHDSGMWLEKPSCNCTCYGDDLSS